MSTVHVHHVASLLYLLVIGVAAYLIWDISTTFIRPGRAAIAIIEELPYFIPALMILALIRLGWYHERFEGIVLILSSFLFLPIYRLSVSLGLFASLFFLGILFLLDDYRRRVFR